MRKIDWKNVWKEFDELSQRDWQDWDIQQKRIQRLVNKQIKSNNKRKKSVK